MSACTPLLPAFRRRVEVCAAAVLLHYAAGQAVQERSTDVAVRPRKAGK